MLLLGRILLLLLLERLAWKAEGCAAMWLSCFAWAFPHAAAANNINRYIANIPLVLQHPQELLQGPRAKRLLLPLLLLVLGGIVVAAMMLLLGFNYG